MKVTSHDLSNFGNMTHHQHIAFVLLICPLESALLATISVASISRVKPLRLCIAAFNNPFIHLTPGRRALSIIPQATKPDDQWTGL